MRFVALSLERYGVYEKLSVPFAPGLNVIYGLNEAGKSTCLAAVLDFLFGIPNNTSRGQRYGYDAMRIGAALDLAGDTRLELRRRKGRGRTLLDLNGGTVDEAILSKPLGAVTRERFSTMFGLDHHTLREGGEALLKAEGDIGRLIIEAGGGLRALVESIDKLKEEADSLFSLRASDRRRFYQVSGQFSTAEKEVKEGTLTFDAYQQAKELLKQSEERHQKLKLRRTELERQQLAMQRALRVLPLCEQLDRIDQEIKQSSDVAYLREGFVADVEIRCREREQAAKELAESTQRYEGLEDQIKNLSIDEALLGFKAEIATIHEKSINVEKQRGDRPKREKELDEQKVRLVRLREYFGLEPEADLESYLPPAEVRQEARQLAGEGRSLREGVARGQKQVEENEGEQEEIQQTQRELERGEFHRTLDVDLANLKTLPRLLRETEERKRGAEQSEAQIKRELAAWGFSDVTEIQALECPDSETIELEIERRKKITDDQTREEEKLREASKQLSLAQATIERLQAAGEMPTETAILQARSARKQAWEPIRSTYISEDPAALNSIPLQERTQRAGHLEERTEDADHLADRKSAEAQRLTDLAAAEKQRDAAGIEIEAAKNALKELEDKGKRESDRFEHAWLQAMQRENDLSRLKLLAKQRYAVLEKASQAVLLRNEAQTRQEEIDPLLADLALAESEMRISSSPGMILEKRLREVERATQGYRQKHDEWSGNALKLESLQKQKVKARKEVEKLSAEELHWGQKWQESMNRMDLPADSRIEFVEQVLDELSNALPALALIENTQHRLDRFEEDEKELRLLIEPLVGQLNFKLPDDPVAAAKMLFDQLEDANKLQAQKRALEAQLRDAARERQTKNENTERLDGIVRGLCEEAAADEASLQQVAERLQDLIQKRQTRDQTLEQINTAGDGKSLEELRTECEGREPDALRVELLQIATEKENVEEEIQQAYAETRLRQKELEKFSAVDGINAAEFRRQSAAAEMREIIERYLEVKLAEQLLHEAIDRLRQERQDPLIARAGELFRLATRGSFSGIATDIDDRDIPVIVGKHPNGELVRVDLMSDGTRDQLFLAFRIASVEQYGDQTEPLPFIADDVLVHFDDDRSKAALEMLAELGFKTQVLLFTHHRSVRSLAEELVQKGRGSIYDLPDLIG